MSQDCFSFVQESEVSADTGEISDPPHAKLEASVATDTQTWRSSLQERGSCYVSRNNQWEICSLRAPHTRVSLEERWPFEIATFISLVNSRAPGTTKEKETHLPTKRWSVLIVTVLVSRNSRINFKNFYVFSG